MAKISSAQQSGERYILLKPNNSLSWRGNTYIILSITLVALIISLGFAMLGAWIIFPFSRLELLCVTGCRIIWPINGCFSKWLFLLSIEWSWGKAANNPRTVES